MNNFTLKDRLRVACFIAILCEDVECLRSRYMYTLRTYKPQLFACLEHWMCGITLLLFRLGLMFFFRGIQYIMTARLEGRSWAWCTYRLNSRWPTCCGVVWLPPHTVQPLSCRKRRLFIFLYFYKSVKQNTICIHIDIDKWRRYRCWGGKAQLYKAISKHFL